MPKHKSYSINAFAYSNTSFIRGRLYAIIVHLPASSIFEAREPSPQSRHISEAIEHKRQTPELLNIVSHSVLTPYCEEKEFKASKTGKSNDTEKKQMATFEAQDAKKA